MRRVDLEGCTLALMVTLGCYSRCAHCCLECGADKVMLRLSEQEMVSYIQEAADVGIRSVVFTGGEPTIYLESLQAPMALARESGMYVDLRTNGYWAWSAEVALRMLGQLRDWGVDRLGLSFDKFHARYVSIGCVRNAIGAAEMIGLDAYVDWIGRETREQVAESLGINGPTLRMVGPPLRVGRAKELGHECFDHIPIEEVEHHSEFSHSCGGGGDSPALTIFPGGHVSLHACCWVNPALVMRRARNEGWLLELVEAVANSPAVAFLCDHGLGGLIGLARQRRPALLKPLYSHQCEACFDLLGELFSKRDIRQRTRLGYPVGMPAGVVGLRER